MALAAMLFTAACQGAITPLPTSELEWAAAQTAAAIIQGELKTQESVITPLPDILPTQTDNLPDPPVITAAPTLSVLIQTTDPATLTPPAPTPTLPSSRLPAAPPRPQPAKMRITQPGPYSMVSSPIELEALISPGDDNLVYIDLIGEDGRIMVSEVLDFRNYDAKNFYITPKIPFSINGAAELARIVVYTYDMFGQMISLVSVEILLLQMGGSDITPALIEYEPYLVTMPREGTLLTGGTLTVAGAARLVNDKPLLVELIDEQGVIVGSGELLVSQPSDAYFHVPFELGLTYTVTHRTRVRMAIRQESATRIPGTIWMSSSILFLDP